MIRKYRYFTWRVVAMMTFFCVTVWAADTQEQKLIDVLKSDAPKAEKAITCKKLAIYGSADAVPALAPLLEDWELTSWARIALEAIPGEAADAALRNALDKVDGRILVGVINSIGNRRDAKAIDGLAAKLKSDNVAVVTAAAVALGHIGGDAAAKPLVESLPTNPAVAEGCILCAEGYLENGQSAKAMKLYDAVRQAKVPAQRGLEALRGAILSRGSTGVPLLVEQLESSETEKVSIGLRTARELSGRDVTEALAVELEKLSPTMRPMLLLALADRQDASVLPVVVKAAKSGSLDVRVTAVKVLMRLGNASCVPTLLEAAVNINDELSDAAKEALIRLPGDEVDNAILAELNQAQGKECLVLVEVAGQRQLHAALPAVVKNLKSNDPQICSAAVDAVGLIGQADQAADLVALLKKTGDTKERQAVEKSLLSISGRCGTACVGYLIPLTKTDDDQLHMIGLHALAIVGGSDALATVKSAIADGTETVQNEAVRVLSTWPNNWPDDDAAGEALLSLAKTSDKMSHQVLGLRGYLQYVRGRSGLGSDEKLARVKAVLDLAKRPEERRLAVAVIGTAPSATSLELLTTLAQDTAVAEEVYAAMVDVTQNDAPGLTKEQRRDTLKMVAAKSNNRRTKRRASDALNAIR